MVTAEWTTVEILGVLKDRRWTDAAIAKELGVTGNTVWRWRNGWTVQMDKMVRLALTTLIDRP